jgi:hypothetical protein
MLCIVFGSNYSRSTTFSGSRIRRIAMATYMSLESLAAHERIFLAVLIGYPFHALGDPLHVYGNSLQAAR